MAPFNTLGTWEVPDNIYSVVNQRVQPIYLTTNFHRPAQNQHILPQATVYNQTVLGSADFSMQTRYMYVSVSNNAVPGPVNPVRPQNDMAFVSGSQIIPPHQYQSNPQVIGGYRPLVPTITIGETLQTNGTSTSISRAISLHWVNPGSNIVPPFDPRSQPSTATAAQDSSLRQASTAPGASCSGESSTGQGLRQRRVESNPLPGAEFRDPKPGAHSPAGCPAKGKARTRKVPRFGDRQRLLNGQGKSLDRWSDESTESASCAGPQSDAAEESQGKKRAKPKKRRRGADTRTLSESNILPSSSRKRQRVMRISSKRYERDPSRSAESSRSDRANVSSPSTIMNARLQSDEEEELRDEHERENARLVLEKVCKLENALEQQYPLKLRKQQMTSLMGVLDDILEDGREDRRKRRSRKRIRERKDGGRREGQCRQKRTKTSRDKSNRAGYCTAESSFETLDKWKI